MESENQKPKIYINPPPQDKKCERCGKHISELKPFGKAGDPLNGDFNGALLLKTFRPMCEETIEEYEKILAECTGDNTEELELKYGKEKVEHTFLYDQVKNTVAASWECRDCIVQ